MAKTYLIGKVTLVLFKSFQQYLPILLQTEAFLKVAAVYISHAQWVHLFRLASEGTKSSTSVMVLFCSAKTALNASATMKPVSPTCIQGLLPRILLCLTVLTTPATERWELFRVKSCHNRFDCYLYWSVFFSNVLLQCGEMP